MNHRWGSQRLTYLSAALMSLWMLGITVVIAIQPDRGAPDPQVLTEQFASAVAKDDRAGVKRLVYGDVDPPAIERLMRDARCGPTVSATPTRLDIVLADGTVCGSVSITEHSGRWFIDPWSDPVQRA